MEVEQHEQPERQHQPCGADHDQARPEARHSRQAHERRRGALETGVPGRDRKDRVLGEQVVVPSYLVRVEGVEELVRHRVAERVAHQLDGVQRQSQHADQRDSLADRFVGGAQPVDDGRHDDGDPGPQKPDRRRLRGPRQVVRDRTHGQPERGEHGDDGKTAERAEPSRLCAGTRDASLPPTYPSWILERRRVRGPRPARDVPRIRAPHMCI